MVFWVRADLGVTITGSGASGWTDQSLPRDANKDLAQGTDAKRPTRNSVDAAYNNKTTLSFASASTQSMFSPAWAAAIAQPYTVMVVGNDDGTAANQCFTCDDSQFSALVETNEGAAVGLDIYAGAQLNSGVARSSSPRVYVGEFNGASSKTYVSAKTASITGNAGAANLVDLRVGMWVGEGGAPLNGKIAEVVIANKVLSAGEMASITAYFGARYNITIGA